MTIAGLAGAMAAALMLLTFVLNHVHARLALVEVALNEGLPPGHDKPRATGVVAAPATVAALVGRGVHIFLSRGCHACQRLIEELDDGSIAIAAPIVLHYVDRPRPVAMAVATVLGAELRVHEAELAGAVTADPLPYTIAVGEHRLVARAVTPTVRQVLAVARDAALASTNDQRA